MKKISFSEYRDKIHAGWLGKVVGGTLGGPLEGQCSMHDLTYYPELPGEGMENDDLDIQLIWLHALHERGPYIDSMDLTEEWNAHSLYPNCEYGLATENFRKGIYPPLSGRFNNELFHNGMGSPIRAEIWGFICPGNPKLAAEYAQADSELDHYDSSVHGEQFIAAMEAVAFFEKDADNLLDTGLSTIPPKCKLARVIRDVRHWHSREPNWKFCRRLILDRYGCPDMTNCKQNIGFIVMAMLYSRMCFESAILMAVNSGYDTDCTCATAGSIIGVALGTGGIPARWKEPIGDSFVIGTAVKDLPRENTVTALTDETCRIGCEVALTRNREVSIEGAPRVQEPRGPKAVPSVAISVEYAGDPEIGLDGSREIDVVVRNNTDKALEDDMVILRPERFVIGPTSSPVKVDAGCEKRFRHRLALVPDCRKLPMINLLDVKFAGAEYRFGLSGSTPWKAMGPFPNNDGKGLEVAFLNEPEGVSEETKAEKENPPLFQVRAFNCPTDVMYLDDIFGGKEPWVMYLYRCFECPEARKGKVRIASSDGYKMWVNDRQVFSLHKHRWPVAHQDFFEFDLKKGKNRIVLKVVRCATKIDFTFKLLNPADPPVDCSDYHAMIDIVHLRP